MLLYEYYSVLNAGTDNKVLDLGNTQTAPVQIYSKSGLGSNNRQSKDKESESEERKVSSLADTRCFGASNTFNLNRIERRQKRMEGLKEIVSGKGDVCVVDFSVL